MPFCKNLTACVCMDKAEEALGRLDRVKGVVAVVSVAYGALPCSTMHQETFSNLVSSWASSGSEMLGKSAAEKILAGCCSVDMKIHCFGREQHFPY